MSKRTPRAFDRSSGRTVPVPGDGSSYDPPAYRPESDLGSLWPCFVEPVAMSNDGGATYHTCLDQRGATMLAIGDRWRSTWSRELFSPDHTWQRTFIEEWGRGPASRMVVFLVANLCMSVLLLTGAYSRTSETVAVAGNCTNVPCDAEEERQPAMAVGAATRLYSAMQTIIGVLTYVTALLVFRATKLNMLVPSRERRAKVAALGGGGGRADAAAVARTRDARRRAKVLDAGGRG